MTAKSFGRAVIRELADPWGHDRAAAEALADRIARSIEEIDVDMVLGQCATVREAVERMKDLAAEAARAKGALL